MYLPHYTVFCDMDGVLCDFIAHFEKSTGLKWVSVEKDGKTQRGSPENREALKGIENFWFNLPWMPGGQKLWQYLKKRCNPIILSSPGDYDTERSRNEKHRWVQCRLGNVPIIFRKSSNKQSLAAPDAILIDDHLPNIERWQEAGGLGIHHLDVASTIEHLEELCESPPPPIYF